MMYPKKSEQLVALLALVILTSCKNETPRDEWTGDQLVVLNLRQASNDALKYRNLDKQLSVMADDITITTGNGIQLQGKEQLRNYINGLPSIKMYWIRTPDEIEVNAAAGKAWESGTWKAFDPDEGLEAISGGKYAAMWVFQDGKWRIKSELFVTLPLQH